MESRINYAKAAPGVLDALLHVSGYLRKSGLEESLVNLICLRASQINGCAYCIDMHWKDLRAALAWTEAVTLVTEGHAPDEVYQTALFALLS